jgi:hypothetical protein
VTDISEPNASISIDVDKQTTLVHFSHFFNLGNYENEKIGITLQVIPGQAVQDVIKAAEAAVNQQYEDYQSIRDNVSRAREKLWQLECQIRGLEEQKAALGAAIESPQNNHPEAAAAVASPDADEDVTEYSGDAEE